MIAFVNTNLILCGGIITNFEYVKELRKRGIEVELYANEGNPELEASYGITHLPLSELKTNHEDIIIANRWEQCEELNKYQGRKIQFVQGRDIDFYKNHTDLPKLIEARNNPSWELIGVSEFCLKDWGRGIVIPNGVNERFFKDYGVERDIEALIEGNNEPNKNIPYAIEQAKKDGHKKIVWLGRETCPVDGVETITNPPQEEIPKIYQRAKHFYKYSISEGFSLSILEALLSGCEVHTHDQGHNFPELTKEYAKQFTWEKSTNKLLEYLNEIPS